MLSWNNRNPSGGERDYSRSDTNYQKNIEQIARLLARGKKKRAFERYLEIYRECEATPYMLQVAGDLALTAGLHEQAGDFYRRAAKLYEKNGKLRAAQRISQLIRQLSSL